jgi:hypothetical protein
LSGERVRHPSVYTELPGDCKHFQPDDLRRPAEMAMGNIFLSTSRVIARIINVNPDLRAVSARLSGKESHGNG